MPAVPKEAEGDGGGRGQKEEEVDGGFARIKGDRESSRLSMEFDLAPEVDKGRMLWINYRNYVISLSQSLRARAVDDSKSN